MLLPHGAIAHFPIALSIVAAFLFTLSLIGKNAERKAAALWLLDVATLSAIAAIVTGLASENAAEKAGLSAAAHELLQLHGALGYGAGGALAAIVLLRRLAPDLPQQRAWIYLALMIAVTVLVGINSYIGGKMVFEHGVGVTLQPISQPSVLPRPAGGDADSATGPERDAKQR